MTVTLVNPLPLTLANYQEALVQVLERAGESEVTTRNVGIENDGRRRLSRAVSYCNDLVHVRRQRLERPIVLWPTFGYLELPVEAALVPTASLIFHDASPMVDQLGMRRWQARVAAPLTRLQRHRVLVHTQAARDVLAALGWRNLVRLPLPVMPRAMPRARPAGRRFRCLVIGQFKPTRALGLLEQLVHHLPDFDLRIVGRGWPPIAGWTVRSEFVDELEFDRELTEADVLLVPYETYFQSGVMVRAFEAGLPTISIRHEQAIELFGESWAGLVDELTADRVAEAAVQLSSSGHVDLRTRRDDHLRFVVEMWRGYLDADR